MGYPPGNSHRWQQHRKRAKRLVPGEQLWTFFFGDQSKTGQTGPLPLNFASHVLGKGTSLLRAYGAGGAQRRVPQACIPLTNNYYNVKQ